MVTASSAGTVVAVVVSAVTTAVVAAAGVVVLVLTVDTPVPGNRLRDARNGLTIPPTLNLDHPSVETAIDLIPHAAKKREINTVLSNSFGFGGQNACLVMSREPV